MAATPQTQAIAIVNNTIGFAAQLQALLTEMNVNNQLWNQNTIGTVLAAWPTVALNADGSLGAADGSPVEAHPVDTSKIPISRALSPTTILSIQTLLTAVSQLLSGGAPPTQQGEAPQVLAAVVLG